MAPLIPVRIKSPMSNSDEMSKSRRVVPILVNFSGDEIGATLVNHLRNKCKTRVVLGAVSDKCWVLGEPVDRELVDQGLAVIIDE